MSSNARIKHCSLCKNHGEIRLKKKHICEFEKCDCDFCDLTRRCQKAMCHQQRVWRHHKVIHKKKLTSLKGQQACDRCRNHGIIIEKKSHECSHTNCTCPMCDLNNVRKVLLKHQQRVRRANVCSQQPNKSLPSKENENVVTASSSKRDAMPKGPPIVPDLNSLMKPRRKLNMIEQPVSSQENYNSGGPSESNQTSPVTSKYNDSSTPSPRCPETPPPLIPIRFEHQPNEKSTSVLCHSMSFNNQRSLPSSPHSFATRSLSPEYNQQSLAHQRTYVQQMPHPDMDNLCFSVSQNYVNYGAQPTTDNYFHTRDAPQLPFPIKIEKFPMEMPATYRQNYYSDATRVGMGETQAYEWYSKSDNHPPPLQRIDHGGEFNRSSFENFSKLRESLS